jgi:hypothetical protein
MPRQNKTFMRASDNPALVANVRALKKTGHTYKEIAAKTDLTYNQVVGLMLNHINRTSSKFYH